MCLLCPMYVTSLIRNARTGLASSLLKEFPMSAIWCRMWKYENIDTFCNPNIFTGNCHCDNFDFLKVYLPLNFMHVSICVFIFQLGRSILTFPHLDQKKEDINFFSARASGSLRPDRLFAQWFAAIRENSFVWRFGKYWIFLSYPAIIIISLTFYLTCYIISFFCRNVKSVFA